MSDIETEPATEEEYEPDGVRAVYPAGVPIYPWNDPMNGTKIVEHEGEETPTGEEATAALNEQAAGVAAGELDPITGQPYATEDDKKALESGEDVA
jgi:hypothetical protein